MCGCGQRGRPVPEVGHDEVRYFHAGKMPASIMLPPVNDVIAFSI